MYEEATETKKTGIEKISSILASIGKFIVSFIETIVVELEKKILI